MGTCHGKGCTSGLAPVETYVFSVLSGELVEIVAILTHSADREHLVRTDGFHRSMEQVLCAVVVGGLVSTVVEVEGIVLAAISSVAVEQ